MSHHYLIKQRQNRPALAPARGTTFERAKPIALGLILAVLAVAGLRILVDLQHVLILGFLAVLFAATMSQPAAVLERHRIPRGMAVVIVQLVATAVLVALLWIVVPPLVTQLALFADEAPSYATRFHHLRDEYVSVKRQYPGAGTFDSGISSLAARLAGGVGGQLVNLPLTAAQLVFDLGCTSRSDSSGCRSPSRSP